MNQPQASTSEIWTKIQSVEGTTEYRLNSNGLQVLLHPDHSAPVVTVMVTYWVGSRNEEKSYTGAAHLLEHMMFKGTEKYHRRHGTAIARLLQQYGALMNATTSFDHTQYYEMLPSGSIDIALDIESDRMRGSLIEEIEIAREMQVVRSELERYDNSSLAVLETALWGKAFQKHPYGKPIIGYRQDVENTPASYLKIFYDRYYQPDNATLTIVGDFELEATMELIAEKFGKVTKPEREALPAVATEDEQNETRHIELRRPDHLEAVFLGFKSAKGGLPESMSLKVLSQILAGGKTGLLYKRLIDSGLAVSVNAGQEALKDPGLFVVQVILAPGVKHQEIYDVTMQIIDQVKRDGVVAEDLETARQLLLADDAYSRDGSFAIASHLSARVAIGNWTLFARNSERIHAVTNETIREAARKYLQVEKMTSAFLFSDPDAITAEVEHQAVEESPEEESQDNELGLAWVPLKAVEGTLSQRAQMTEWPGVRLISVATEVKDVVAMYGSFHGAGELASFNPILTSLTAGMLDKGTKNYNKTDFARELEGRGAQIHFDTDFRRLGFSARFLNRDLKKVTELLAQALREPAFPEDELELLRNRTMVGLRHVLTDTSSRAKSKLNQMIYPQGHPLHDLPIAEQIEQLKAISIQDIRDFYQANYGPQDFIIVAVGDVKHDELVKYWDAVLAGWPPAKPLDKKIAKVKMNEPEESNIFLQGKNNIDVYMGHALPITRLHPDYQKLQMANFILGGDFSSRLPIAIRDLKGLTYSIRSSFSGITSESEGMWLIHFITTPANLERGIVETLKEVEDFVTHGMDDLELERKKSTLIGQYEVAFATTEGTADRILTFMENELDIQFIDQFPLLIESLSAEDINATVRKYFDPKKFHLSLAGHFDELGTRKRTVEDVS